MHWFAEVNRQKTTVNKKITWKILFILYSIFRKGLCNLQIFYRSVFRSKVLRPFVFFFVWSSVHINGIFFIARRKCVDLVVIFHQGRDETFAVSLQNRKSCFCIKYLTLVRPRKLIVVNFTFLYLFILFHTFLYFFILFTFILCKMRVTPVLLKIINFIIF